jgi:hypothetical protein
MSDSIEHDSASIRDDDRRRDVLPDELPPVEPPSAGFIVQLFVIPGIIVAALIGAWTLFDRMVSGQQDVGHVMNDLASTNEHRRWRAAFNLAQMLEADAHLGEDGQQLAQNPQVAAALAGLLQEQVRTTSKDEKHLRHQAFLAKTLGWFDVPDVVIPALQGAMKITPEPRAVGGAARRPDRFELPGEEDAGDEIRALQQDVRCSAIGSVARIAGRAAEQGAPLDHPELVKDLIALCSDESPKVRQLGVFSLGLFPEDAVTKRLTASLLDADENTRINAAIALARQGSSAGYSVLSDVLQEAAEPVLHESADSMTAEQRRLYDSAMEFRRLVAVRNTLKAVEELGDRFEAEQRAHLATLIQRHADTSKAPEIRTAAKEALAALAD